MRAHVRVPAPPSPPPSYLGTRAVYGVVAGGALSCGGPTRMVLPCWPMESASSASAEMGFCGMPPQADEWAGLAGRRPGSDPIQHPPAPTPRACLLCIALATPQEVRTSAYPPALAEQACACRAVPQAQRPRAGSPRPPSRRGGHRGCTVEILALMRPGPWRPLCCALSASASAGGLLAALFSPCSAPHAPTRQVGRAEPGVISYEIAFFTQKHPFGAGLRGPVLPRWFTGKDQRPTTTLDEVVVTAIHDQSAVQVVTDPKIPRQPVPASDAADYLQTIPGFRAVRSGGGTISDPVLRGQFRLAPAAADQWHANAGRLPRPHGRAQLLHRAETFDVLTLVKGPETVALGAGGFRRGGAL